MIWSEKVQTLDLHGVPLPPHIRKIERVLKPKLSTHKNNETSYDGYRVESVVKERDVIFDIRGRSTSFEMF